MGTPSGTSSTTTDMKIETEPWVIIKMEDGNDALVAESEPSLGGGGGTVPEVAINIGTGIKTETEVHVKKEEDDVTPTTEPEPIWLPGLDGEKILSDAGMRFLASKTSETNPDRHCWRRSKGGKGAMKCDSCLDYNKGVQIGRCSVCTNQNEVFRMGFTKLPPWDG